ncbi:hypothetical protein ACN99C_11655 [Pseudomonas alloputida]|uniref:hypothetical protein n=1 Tax=Pseudomonas alloputida TaxID=1940621 RepID=UPI003B429AA4
MSNHNIDKMVVTAIKNLIRRNDGEFHGFWPEIAELIAGEISGIPADDFYVSKYDEHLREMGLKYFFEDHPDIVFFRGAFGDLNFVDRKLVYTVSEVTVHRAPGRAPVITHCEVDHAE